MKPLLLAAALGLPISAAATVAMEPQQVEHPAHASQPQRATTGRHRQMFIVKYVLRTAPSERAPQIVVDDAAPQLLPPAKGFPATPLGAVRDDPNVLICHGWGCQRRP